MSGTLYVVATPIGNSNDISERAIKVLNDVALVAAEDTRTTQNLLHMLGLKKHAVANHKFNENYQCDNLVAQLLDGNDIALVSDAGTPCISDPGYALVKAAVENNITVVGIPGPCAAITALSISGFDLSSFAFYGFLPKTPNDIRKVIGNCAWDRLPVYVFYESPKRIKATLTLLEELMPTASICLCNDLSKLHERIYRGSPNSVLNELINNPNCEKGEYTLIVNYSPDTENKKQNAISPEGLIINWVLNNDGSVKDAVKALSDEYKGTISSKEFYSASLRIKEFVEKIYD